MDISFSQQTESVWSFYGNMTEILETSRIFPCLSVFMIALCFSCEYTSEIVFSVGGWHFGLRACESSRFDD